MKKFLINGILVICLLTVTVISDAIAAEKLQRKIRLGALPGVGVTGLYADYIGAWKAEGLDVEVNMFQGGPAIVEALTAGSLDFGGFGYVPMILAAGRGLPLYYLASDGIATKEYPMFMLTVRPDSNIKSFKDLKGKVIALHARGTPEDLFLTVACEKYGINKSDLKITLVPWPQQGGVLMQKQVDAAFPHPPFEALQEFNKQGRGIMGCVSGHGVHRHQRICRQPEVRQ